MVVAAAYYNTPEIIRMIDVTTDDSRAGGQDTVRKASRQTPVPGVIVTAADDHVMRPALMVTRECVAFGHAVGNGHRAK